VSRIDSPGSRMRHAPESPRGSAAFLQQRGQISGAPCENVRLNMSIVQPFSSQKTLNAQRSIIFCIQCWTLHVGRCTLPIHSRRGGRAVDCAGLENRKAEWPREFESHPLRQLDYQALTTTSWKCITPPHNATTARGSSRLKEFPPCECTF